jgi:hypothetical protein
MILAQHHARSLPEGPERDAYMQKPESILRPDLQGLAPRIRWNFKKVSLGKPRALAPL